MKLFKSFTKNEVGNDYVVGDIHGCFTLLQNRLDEIQFNPNTDRLFSVGDLVDRGNESQLSIEWLNKDFFHAVLGNHEDMAIEWYYTTKINKSIFSDTDLKYYENNYIKNGGAWFIIEPDKKKIVEAFSELPLAIEVETDFGTVGIIHASAAHFNDWRDLKNDLLNNNDDTYKDFTPEFRLLKDKLTWDRTLLTNRNRRVVENVFKIYHGHTPVSDVVEYGNRVYIDTGAVYNQKLTIIKIN